MYMYVHGRINPHVFNIYSYYIIVYCIIYLICINVKNYEIAFESF